MSAEDMFEQRGLNVRVQAKYKLLTHDQIVAEVEKISKDASEIIGFSPENCKILLHCFKWDPINLIEKFYEACSPKSFLQKNKITLIDESVKDDMVTIDECRNCKNVKDVLILPCSHLFCFDCWKNNITKANAKSNDKNILPYITCSFEDCTTPVPETFVLQLFNDQKELYQNTVVNSFVESNPEFKWCPNQKNGCEKAVKIESSSKVEEITCTCGFTYCFNCEDLPHSPFPCIFIEKWKPEFASYLSHLAVNPIVCYHCSKTVEHPKRTGVLKCPHCYKDFTLHFPEIFIFDTNNPVFQKYKIQYETLKQEYKHLRDLDEITENVDFVKTSFKLLHVFRQKLLDFYIFTHFLNRGHNYVAFEDSQKQIEELLNKVTAQICGPKVNDDLSFTKEQKNEIIKDFVAIKIRLDALLKIYYEYDWKFYDIEIQKVMLECKY